jgi:hypothetical protein
MRNLPDDWNCHWHSCTEHNVKYHAAEGCPICEMSEEEQAEWTDDRDSAIEAEAESRYYDQQYPGWEPTDHPEW